MKFKLVSSYNSDINMYNIANDIWNINGDYDLTYHDDYDYLIIFNGYRGNIKDKTKTFGFIQEPSWKTNLMGIENLSNICQSVFYHKSGILNNDNVIISNSIMLHHLWNKPMKGEIRYTINNTKNIIKRIHKKTKKLSIIVSNRDDISKVGDDRYYRRQKLVSDLLNSDLEFDMFGLGWELEDKRYKGYLSNKIDGLSQYEFSICLENSIEDSYISEKFVDAILCNTVPIYNGAVNVGDYYPEKSFEYINLDGDVISNIKNIINGYGEYSFDESKKLYTEKYNPFYIIKKILSE